MRVAASRHVAVAWAFIAPAAFAQPIKAPAFPMDTPMRMRAIEAVCTGVGEDARSDPRWSRYPLRVEVVGGKGEYVGEAQVMVGKDDEALASVNCGGPWVLFALPPGIYTVTAEHAGTSRSSKANVNPSGQARVVLRFPSEQ
jgi:hypothetical protein